MEKHQEIYSQSGDAIFENMDNNYVGDVLISVSDIAGRYVAKNELVHADLQQLSTSNAEIKIERITPFQSTHSGNYITSFIQDRNNLYYQESAYFVIGLKSTYPNPELIVNLPDGLYSYGAGSISMLDSDTKTVTVRIQNNMFIDSQKIVTFNVSFYENGHSLESVPVTLNIQPSTGSTVLKVKIVDAIDKESLAGSVTALWGSNFGNYKVEWANGGEIATIDLGSYSNGRVVLKVEEAHSGRYVTATAGQYSTATKEIVMTESPLTTTIELERTSNYTETTSSSMNPWVWVGIAIVILVVIAIAALIVFRKKKLIRT